MDKVEQRLQPHEVVELTRWDKKNSTVQARRGHRVMTTALVLDDRTGTLLGQGVAYLNSTDRDNPDLGEFIAIGRALKQARS